MSVNSTSNVDPTLVNQNRNTENLANTETEDENIYAGAIPSNNAEVATQTVETVAISDIEASNEISSLDEPEDIPEFTNKAAEGYNGETDAQLATDITAQILAGADIALSEMLSIFRDDPIEGTLQEASMGVWTKILLEES